MYIFNPEHDLCLANGNIHFVPPQSALEFGRSCASLTKFMQGLDKSADLDNINYQEFNPTVANIKKIMPWGWNSVLRTRLLKEGYPAELMPTDEQLQAIKELSHRRVALKAHAFIEDKLKITPADYRITPAGYRIAAKSVKEVEDFLKQHTNIVLKAPLSGSGKGIRFVSGALSHSDSGWCRNLIQKHGCVIVEQRFKPVLECAMLFECTNNNVSFKGYSLFYASNGMYSGNILASNKFIEKQISRYLSGQTLKNIKCALTDFLQENVAEHYSGFVGVDQFVYTAFDGFEKSYKNDIADNYFNPVVEINLRMTMGLLARNIYDNFSQELNLQDGSHHFEIIHSKSGMSYRIKALDKSDTVL